MIKILIGGSPCTFWSIAKKNGRETEADGMGWELFKNYLIAKEKFKPDFFLYENNKSASQPIKNQISRELGVDLMYINSALVSAQNRQRFYAFNWEVEQPKDRGILLKDILESGIPVNTTADGKAGVVRDTCYKDTVRNLVGNDYDRRTCVAEPILVGNIGECETIQKAIPKLVEKYGYIPEMFNAYNLAEINEKSPTLSTGSMVTSSCATTKFEKADKPVYEVKDGYITIKGKQYPIKLPNGYYIIRKLTVEECARLQTMPDDYCRAVSNAQAYKGLGNGWTAEVIIHILSSALKDIPKDEEIIVLSMYDGIGTGRYCLDKMGFTNVKYYAYEIDKFAKQIALSNYPDIIQMGDAFDLRKEDWLL